MQYRLPNVHRYPTVEYIPLAPHILWTAPAWPNLNGGKFDLIISDSNRAGAEIIDGIPRKAREQLARLGPDQVGLISLNFEIQELMYRGNTTTIVAEEIPDHLSIYTIVKRFFYKPTIIFEAYNHKGQKLAWAKLDLKK